MGTPFDEIGEPTETSDGKAFGKGGQARIIFTLFQVVNSIHLTLTEKRLIDDFAAGRQATDYDRIVSEYDKLPLSDAMFARLVDVAEADAVVAKIDELQPATLRARQPSDCHRLVTRQLAIADQFNMQQARVRQHFSMLVLMLREEFALEPEMQQLLDRVRNGASYDTEMSNLPDVVWDRVSNTAE